MTRKTALDLWLEANERVEVITPEDLAKEIKSGVTVLDVRLPKETARSGKIPKSMPVPRQVIEWWADPASPYFRAEGVFGDFDRRFVTYCDGGGNGAFAAVTLQELGYGNVATLEGGFHGWVAADMPVEHETPEEGQ